METRVAIISIIVEDGGKIEEINRLLHETNEYIIGRMGIPYRQIDIGTFNPNISTISTLSGKIGRLSGVTTKTAYSNVITKTE